MADVDSVRAVVSFIGITNQLVGTILLFCLFSVLLEKSERRLYFVMWRRAWAALMIALIALFPIVAFQSGILDATGPRWWQPLSLVIYLVGKLGFLLYLVAGVLIYSGATNIRKYFPPAIALVLVYSVVTYIFSANYYQTVIWQSPLYVAAMSYSGFVLFNLPKPRRSRGTQFTAIVLLFSALIWILYLVAFKESIVDGVISTETPFGILVRMNNYAELFIAVLMAFGMIRILHETDLRDLRSAQSDLSVANQSLKREVLLDPLTGIYNRRAFDEGTGLEAARVTFGAVAVLDVDDLKKINDKFGHAAGDELLKHCAGYLRKGIRPADKLYRWGGDEFLIVMPEADAESASVRLRNLVLELPPFTLPDRKAEKKVSISVGVARFTSAEDLKLAVNLADESMYEYKRYQKRRTVK